MPNGDLLAAWYGGRDEVGEDVKIFASRFHDGGWWPIETLVTREQSQHDLHMRVKSVGNPVLFADSSGVSLFYVSVLAGGWSGGTICVKRSPDGKQWSAAKRLATSPFLNVGMLVRSPPVSFADGTVALPIYHELLDKWSALARVDRDGRVVDETRISDGRPLVQPWMIATGPRSAVALLRWSSRMPGSVTVVHTEDSGATWSDIAGTRLVHRDSAVAGIRLRDGSLLVAWNNSAWDRRDLSIARSRDAGVHWSLPRPIERDTTPDNIVRREYSYPFLVATRDGRYHLLYTFQRSQVRHVTFNDAWVVADPVLAAAR